MSTKDNYTLFTPEKAETIAKDLQAYDPEWEYRVVHDPTGKGLSFIEVYDKDGMFINKL